MFRVEKARLEPALPAMPEAWTEPEEEDPELGDVREAGRKDGNGGANGGATPLQAPPHRAARPRLPRDAADRTGGVGSTDATGTAAAGCLNAACRPRASARPDRSQAALMAACILRARAHAAAAP
mmetsp:Transcript_33901/g.101060  ORF Transcript_33901/g.101060 Transcript_33901/m.101060 type:complete len:125 (-) Transcript_33901:6-380(-)